MKYYNWTKQRIPACPLKQETINNITGNTRSLPYIHNSHCTLFSIPISFVITSQWHGTSWTQQRGPDAILDTGRKNTWFYLFYFLNYVYFVKFVYYSILEFSTFVNLNISRRSSGIDTKLGSKFATLRGLLRIAQAKQMSAKQTPIGPSQPTQLVKRGTAWL